MALVLKTSESQGSVSSNLTASANNTALPSGMQPLLMLHVTAGFSTSAFGEMDIIPGFEPGGGSSILSGPARLLRVVQRIEPGPPKT